MVGTGEVEPQACHSCNVIGGPSLLLMRASSVGLEVEAHFELWAAGFLVKESIWTLVESGNANDGERLNVGAKALKVESIVLVDFDPPISAPCLLFLHFRSQPRRHFLSIDTKLGHRNSQYRNWIGLL